MNELVFKKLKVVYLFDVYSILSCVAVKYQKLSEQLFLLHNEFDNVVKNLKKSLFSYSSDGHKRRDASR